MESFDNFQFDSASSYGGIPVVDDTSSIVSGYTGSAVDTPNDIPSDLESLSVLSLASRNDGDSRNNQGATKASVFEEDFDGVLDDLKDENSIELPPHACRSVQV